jgi:hypothetical protein
MTFTERIGGVLVAPRRTFAALAAGEARAGDVTWLLVLRVVAGDLPRIVRAFLLGRELGPMAGLQSLLMVVRDRLPDVVGILAAGVLMQMLTSKEARGHGRAFDVAGYAWIPYLAVQLAGALVLTALQRPATPQLELTVDLVGVAAALAVWTVALVEARRPA